ncbi:MAG: 4-hydroxy-tetrahydrodipicolinate reductase, partial [Candidatus Lokiarchaeota archaeon]
KLLILGPTGEMGKLIVGLAFEDPEIEVVAACDVNNVGVELKAFLPINDPNNIKINHVDKLEEILKKFNPDIVVDFTTAKATEKNAPICVKNGKKCVIGTTGLSNDFINEFKLLVREKNIPAVISPNMSSGINILFKIVEILTSYLKDWDIEIIETHHHRKLDAPSGTALKIANIISQALNVNLDEIAKYGRDKGPNKRKIGASNELGIHSIRGGDIIGDHTILFAGKGERIELTHQAQSRICFAEGSIKAIKFLSRVNDGKIYSTNDVLKL